MKTGQTIKVSGHPLVLKKPLGRGGQGEVWLCSWKGGDYALKMYYQNRRDPKQRSGLMDLARKPAPSPAFVWPLAFVEVPEIPGRFGYVMPKLRDDMVSFEKIYMGVAKVSTRIFIKGMINLAEAFRALHLQGLSYNDLNLGGFFISPTTGEIQVVDNDNVRVNNDPNHRSAILFPGFGAPEVVEGAACNNRSDDHSLAVVVFHMLCRGNPFDGELERKINCINAAAQKMLYGSKALFVFHPTNPRNRPHPVDHRAVSNYWPTLHPAIQDVFQKAFVDGLHSPAKRPNERVWQAAFAAYRDSLQTCTSCGQDGYMGLGRCPHCDAVQAPARVVLKSANGRTILLNPRTEIYDHHVGGVSFLQRVGEVVSHPSVTGSYGIKNLSSQAWTALINGSANQTVDPGRSVPIKVGNQIAVNNVVWEIGDQS